MNTLYFLAGAGAGSLLTVLLSIWSVGRVNKQSADRAEKHQRATEELMRERNDLDRRKVAELENIHNLLV